MASRDNPDFLSAESLMDDKVINADGEDLGKFDDLMIDLAEGKIAYAALSFGGTLGMGNKLFAIPWKALTLRVHEHAFVLDIPKEVLKNAEGFDKDNWPATSRESLSTMYSYYGYQPYWETETTRRINLSEETESERLTRTTRTEDVDNSGFLRASKIQGEKVVNRDNDTLGKIEDIMIDLQDGRIAYAVISHGGIIGIGSKHIPIPWQAFSLGARDHAFVIDIPKDVLDKAEGLDKDKWPVTREELSRTYSYYGYQPYWQMGAAAGLAGVSAAATKMEPETTTQMESERVVRAETA
ncbi:MAG: PRC-barrel domain containing protein, partial [Alphaproteobacteria bacterium]